MYPLSLCAFCLSLFMFFLLTVSICFLFVFLRTFCFSVSFSFSLAVTGPVVCSMPVFVRGHERASVCLSFYACT